MLLTCTSIRWFEVMAALPPLTGSEDMVVRESLLMAGSVQRDRLLKCCTSLYAVGAEARTPVDERRSLRGTSSHEVVHILVLKVPGLHAGPVCSVVLRSPGRLASRRLAGRRGGGIFR